MKRAVAAVAVVLAGSLTAESVDPIGWRQNGGVNVDSGKTVSIDQPLQVGAQGTFVKTGEGTLNVPIAAFDKYRVAENVVMAGTVKLTGDAVIEPEPSVPDCLAKAASWFSAMDTSYITVDANAYVQNWYDVRETGVTGDGFAPTRPFMKHMMGDSFLANADDPAAQQTVATYLGCNAVYFGGSAATTKGGFMGLVTADGNADLNHERVYSAFVVHGVKEGLGSLLGAYGNSTNPNDFFNGGGLKLVDGKNNDKRYFYYRGDTQPGTVTARYYLNGEAFDPFYTDIQKRVELIGVDYVDRPSRFATFFNQRGRSCISGRYGGDYLSEVVVFTNRLTETEIVEVNRYLMRKWNLMSETGANPRIGIAANGSVETAPLVSASAQPDYTNYYPVTFVGEGTVVKTGTGRMAIGPQSFVDFNGSIALGEGSIHSRFAYFPPIVPAVGKTYTASTQRGGSYDLINGEVISVSSGTSGKVIKSGDDDLTFGGVPDGVGIVEVRRGKVRFAGHDSHSLYMTSAGLHGVFADPGAEKVQVTGTLDKQRHQITAGSTVGGWTRPTGTGNAGILVWPSIVNTDGYWAYEIPEGRQAIYLFKNGEDSTPCELYTTVSFPAAGDYLVSWRETRGYNITAQDYAFTYHVFFGADWASAAEVDHRICADGHYPRVYMKLHVEKAGTYVFGFRVDAAESAKSAGSNYYSITMDDFRADGIVRDADAGVVKIPNGDFEQVYIDGNPDRLAARRADAPTIKNLLTGWTFYQGDGWTAGTPPMIAVSGSMVPAQTIEYNKPANTVNGRFSRTADAESFGKFQLFMAHNPSYAANNHADTTFSVAEPGRYFLRAKASRWNYSYSGIDFMGQNGETPRFAAKVTIGGVETDLGSVLGDQHVQTDRTWPVPFTVTEAGQTVSLSISQTTQKAAGLLDDVVLVKADAVDHASAAQTEYISNGSFEDCTKKTSSVVASTMKNWSTGVVTSGNSAGITFYAGNAYMDSVSQQYVDTPIDGDIACSIRGDGYVWQTLPEMEAGRYRFRFAANTRRGSWQGYGGNGVRAELLDGSDAVVQEICNVESITNFDQRVREFVFDLKTPGTYKLRIIGTKAGLQGPTPATLACVIDGLSLKRVTDGMRTPPSVPEQLVLDVAAGATVDLDFDGTIKVEKVKYAGKIYRGTLTGANCPALTGTGVIETSPKVGVVVIFR